MASVIPEYSKNEELVNAITHGLGIALSIAGLVILVTFSAIYGDVWKVVASSIYGASMVVLYCASTLYHSFKNEHKKKLMNLFDHISIYFLIAGTYTPFVLVSLRGPWGWTIFGIVWFLAIAGAVLKLIYGSRFRRVSTIIYLFMGWLILIAIKPMFMNVETLGMILLLIGGLFYSFGVIFYKWKSLPYNHAIWHLFVLAGTIFQFFAVLYFVILK